jgi:hypothetical protein
MVEWAGHAAQDSEPSDWVGVIWVMTKKERIRVEKAKKREKREGEPFSGVTHLSVIEDEGRRGQEAEEGLDQQRCPAHDFISDPHTESAAITLAPINTKEEATGGTWCCRDFPPARLRWKGMCRQ